MGAATRAPRRSGRWRAFLPPILIYGSLLAVCALVLDLIDRTRLSPPRPVDIPTFAVAVLFLALGLLLGARLWPARAAPLTPDPGSRPDLGISERELHVLRELATGRSNKEIARALDVSPNTVKTHVGSLYAKLEVNNRTAAAARARALGLTP